MVELFQLTQTNVLTGQTERVPAAARINAIVSAPNAKQIIRSLDEQTLYSLISEAGKDDASDLILYATGDQIRALLDFDVWTRDELEPERIEEWLDVILQRRDVDFEAVWRSVDLDVFVVWLRARCQVFVQEEDTEIIEMIDAPISSSPDGVYAIVIPEDDDHGHILRHFIARVYAISLAEGHRLLESVRWEISANSLETAYENRTARMGDLGFVPQHEAVEVYAWLDPVKFGPEARAIADSVDAPFVELTDAGKLPPVDAQVQELQLRRESGVQSFFGESLSALPSTFSGEIISEIADIIFSQFRALTNRVHVADLGHPGDLGAMRDAVARVDRVLSLGLEILSGVNPARAARMLAKIPLIRIHRAGFSALLKLQREAARIVARGNVTLTSAPTSLLDPDDVEIFEGLRQRRPMMSALREIPFSSLEEVEFVTRRIADVAFSEMVFFALLRHTKAELAEMVFDPKRNTSPIEFITFRSLFATRVLCEINSPGGELQPLSLEVVNRLGQQLRANDAHSKLLAAGLQVITRPARDPNQIATLATAYAARVAGWLLDEVAQFRAPISREIARTVLLIAPDSAE